MKKILLMLLLAPNLALSQSTIPQGCCGDSLIINTGYDPYTGLGLPSGVDSSTPVVDPKWIVTSVSPASVTAVTAMGGFTLVPIGSNANVVPVSPEWVVNPIGHPGNWISHFNGNGYNTPGTYGDTIYHATLGRPFVLCANDSIKLDLYLSADNWISATNIDNTIPLSFTQPEYATDNLSSFHHFTQTVWLTAGIHILNVKVNNLTSGVSGNGFGLNIYGALKSASGANSIKLESPYCDSFVLSAPITKTFQTGFEVFPNPSATAITITAPDEITQVAISNLLGQTVFTRDCRAEKVKVDISNLPAGVYLLRINGTEVKKFIKH
jgi:hypothetical protein